MAKMADPRGMRKTAPTAAPAPERRRSRFSRGPRPKSLPRPEPMPAPTRVMGPSRPALPPVPRVRREASHFHGAREAGRFPARRW